MIYRLKDRRAYQQHKIGFLHFKLISLNFRYFDYFISYFLYAKDMVFGMTSTERVDVLKSFQPLREYAIKVYLRNLLFTNVRKSKKEMERNSK